MAFLWRSGWLLLAVALAGCASKPLDRTELMPAPAVFEDGRVHPFATVPPKARQLETEVLFATDRDPAADGDLENHYASRRLCRCAQRMPARATSVT